MTTAAAIIFSCIVLYSITVVTRRFQELFVVGPQTGNSQPITVLNKVAHQIRHYLRLGGILEPNTQMKLIHLGRNTIVAATLFGIVMPLSFGASLLDSLAYSAIAVLFGFVVLVYILESRRKKFRDSLLYDFPFFAQQLFMISRSGDTLEQGFRKIAQVSAARRRFGAIEQLIFMAIEQRKDDMRLEDVLLEIAEKVGSQELQRAVRGKMESDRYGSALSNILRDLSVQSKLKRMKVKYFEAPAFTKLLLRRPFEDSGTTWRFILLLSQKLALNYDTLTSLLMSADGIENGHILSEDVHRLKNDLKNGIPEEQALARFARDFDTVGMNLLVQSLLLSKLSPGKLRDMIQEILNYLKSENLDR
jgi:Flp pilus assembly protein TadB